MPIATAWDSGPHMLYRLHWAEGWKTKLLYLWDAFCICWWPLVPLNTEGYIVYAIQRFNVYNLHLMSDPRNLTITAQNMDKYLEWRFQLTICVLQGLATCFEQNEAGKLQPRWEFQNLMSTLQPSDADLILARNSSSSSVSLFYVILIAGRWLSRLLQTVWNAWCLGQRHASKWLMGSQLLKHYKETQQTCLRSLQKPPTAQNLTSDVQPLPEPGIVPTQLTIFCELLLTDEDLTWMV